MSLPYNFVPIFSAVCLFFGATRPRREYSGTASLLLIGVDVFLDSRPGTTVAHGRPCRHVDLVPGGNDPQRCGCSRFGVGSNRGACCLFAHLGVVLPGEKLCCVGGMENVSEDMGAALRTCYIAAAPFFRNSVVAETISSVVVFGVAQYSQVWTTTRRMQQACSSIHEFRGKNMAQSSRAYARNSQGDAKKAYRRPRRPHRSGPSRCN